MLSECLLTKTTAIKRLQIGHFRKPNHFFANFPLNDVGPSDLTSLYCYNAALKSPKSMLSYMNMQQLSLSDCELPEDCGQHLGELIRGSKNLLRITYKPLSPSRASRLASQAIIDAVANSSNLAVLGIEKLVIDESVAESIKNMLRKNASLLHLSFHRAIIRYPELSTCLEGLVTNKSIISVSFSIFYNTYGDLEPGNFDFSVLERIFTHNCTLKALDADLSHYPGDLSLEQVFDAIFNNQVIQSVPDLEDEDDEDLVVHLRENTILYKRSEVEINQMLYSCRILAGSRPKPAAKLPNEIIQLILHA